MEKITWTALEYEDKDRGSDWFWALGIIVFTSAAAAIIYGNYSFAVLLVLSGTMLAFLATRKPKEVRFELNEKGFVAHDSLYLYENIKSFWVQDKPIEEEELKPLLFIKSERLFMPIILSPINMDNAESIRDFLLKKNILEEEMKESIPEKIMEALGF